MGFHHLWGSIILVDMLVLATKSSWTKLHTSLTKYIYNYIYLCDKGSQSLRSYVIKWLWYIEDFSHFSVSHSKKVTFISAACFNSDPKNVSSLYFWQMCIDIQHTSHFDIVQYGTHGQRDCQQDGGKCSRKALIASKDKAQMEVEVASLLRNIDATQKHATWNRQWWKACKRWGSCIVFFLFLLAMFFLCLCGCVL